MCGIAGSLIWARPDGPEIIGRMSNALLHRGPDAGQVVNRCPAIFGHRRLSIIDLSKAAHQPMCDSQGKVWIVFNGEIYNFRRVREELAGLGIKFSTQSDTEVLLQSYKAWKEKCLEHLNGMFAFAIWDENNQSLFIARDRLGEKPLYYKRVGLDGIIFASELKALRLHPLVGNRLNPRALSQYLSFNYTLTDECILEGVSKLPPASFLYIRKGIYNQPVSYWDLAKSFKSKRSIRSLGESQEALNDILTDSVNMRLESDVPLGAFLSGGIDSSAIVAAMNRLRSPVFNKTFSVGFKEASYNELPQAKFVAEFLSVDHKQQVIGGDIGNDFVKMVYCMDEPFADTSYIPMYYLAKFARTNVTVCLSGDGGDELFGGYETYIADKFHQWGGRQPLWLLQALRSAFNGLFPASFEKVNFHYKVNQFLAGCGLEWLEAHFFWRSIFSDEEKRRLLLPEHHRGILDNDVLKSVRRYQEDVSGCHYLDQAMYLDIKTWLVDDVLHKVDRSTMAHSLESRAPFLDYRLVEFAASLPVEFKIRGGDKKYIFKRSQQKYLPGRVINAPKQGFTSPMAFWLNDDLHDIAFGATSSAKMKSFFDMNYITGLWNEHKSGKKDNSFKIFGLTCLSLWLEQD